MAASDIWYVGLDIDGTIIHEDGTLSDRVRTAIRRVRDAGHRVTLATGRSWESTREYVEVLGIEAEYVVCANGAVTMRKDPEVPGGYRRELIETFDAAPVLDRIRGALPGGSFMVELADGHRLFTEGMADWDLSNARLVEFGELAVQPVTRVVVVSPEHEAEEFSSTIDALGLHQVSYSIGWTSWLDIAPEGVNKGTALERIVERLGVPRDRILVVGDGRNDIEMFEWAARQGRAVAMGQAPDEVKAVATELTASVQDDGLAIVLESLPGV